MDQGWSGVDQFDVAPRSGRELFEVVVVHGDDLVAVLREQHDRGIDHIGEAGGVEQAPGRPPQILVQRTDNDARQRLGEPGLASPAPPHLSEHARMGER